MHAAFAAVGDAPGVARKPGELGCHGANGNTAWSVAIAADVKFEIVGVGEAVCVRAVHRDLLAPMGNRVAATDTKKTLLALRGAIGLARGVCSALGLALRIEEK